MQRYEHTQYGMLMLILIVVIGGLYAFSNAGISASGAVVSFVVPVLVLMCRLRTAVDQRSVSWSFTFGFPAGHIAVADIESAAAIRTNVLEGWGIHWTFFHGWLWNVSGFQAVEIRYGGGKRLTLGTDDPQGLVDAIERFRKGAA